MTNPSNPTNLIATDHGGGAITFWSLSGNASAPALERELRAAGFPEGTAPSLPSPEKALSRALRGVLGNDTILRSVATGTWVVGREAGGEAAKGERWEAHEVARISLLNDGDDLEITPEGWEHEAQVRAAYDHQCLVIHQLDVSNWLVGMIATVSAVRLREKSGGIYYVPPTTNEAWDRLAKAVEAATDHRIYRIPAVKTAEAARAVLHAILTEATSNAEALEEELRSAVLGKRAIQTRLGAAEAQLEKLETYSEFLGDALAGVADRTKKLRADLGRALLAREVEADAA